MWQIKEQDKIYLAEIAHCIDYTLDLAYHIFQNWDKLNDVFSYVFSL